MSFKLLTKKQLFRVQWATTHCGRAQPSARANFLLPAEVALTVRPGSYGLRVQVRPDLLVEVVAGTTARAFELTIGFVAAISLGERPFGITLLVARVNGKGGRRAYRLRASNGRVSVLRSAVLRQRRRRGRSRRPAPQTGAGAVLRLRPASNTEGIGVDAAA